MKMKFSKQSAFRLGFLIITLLGLYLNRIWMQYIVQLMSSKADLLISLQLTGIIVPISLGILWNIKKIISLFRRKWEFSFHLFHLIGTILTVGMIFINSFSPLYLFPTSCQIELLFFGILISGVFEKSPKICH